MHAPVYLDHNATTPLCPEVFEAMAPFLRERFGNPSSRHRYGREARQAIDEARRKVASAVGAHPTEIVFTGGGSEANNLFLKGAAMACSTRPAPGACAPLIAVSAIEHPCVLEPARQLQRRGWRTRHIAVDGEGRLDRESFAAALAEKPRLISVIAANNETGVIQDIAALAAQAQPSGAWFHSDAIQAFGKIPLDFRALNAAGIHAITISSHKIGGPKGVAALVLDKRVELEPLVAGGGHEQGLRSGTENVAAIAGFGLACERARAALPEAGATLRPLRRHLEEGLGALGARCFGAGLAEEERLPNTLAFACPGIDGETLVGMLDEAGFAVSSGAACSGAADTGTIHVSHVLSAMNVPPELARGAVRVSLGRENGMQDIEAFLQALSLVLQKLRSLCALGMKV
ncbi:MAG: cysteine desulfurase [Betaproteobacteria bacterium]|nr:cysteine desulfurase [Betaproteobacteria bacterium]